MAKESESAGVFRCPPIVPGALWLPPEKMHVWRAFESTAVQINEAGPCVMEGSFGTGYNKYYYAVSPTGKFTDAYFLRYTENELMSSGNTHY